MANLTALDLAKLAYPFRRADHEFLQGYVYIQEEAITARLDTVDPDWAYSIDEMIAYGDSIVARATMTVKGVCRSNTGGNPVQREKKDKTVFDQYTQADNGVNAHKAVSTDGLKRCARMFGVGRYLLDAPKVSGDNTTQFDEWLKQEHQQAKTRMDALTGKQVDTATGEITTKSAVDAPQGTTPPLAPKNAPARPSASATAIPVQAVASDPKVIVSTELIGNGVPAQDGFDEPLFPNVEGAKVVTLDNGRKVHTTTTPVPGRDSSGFPIIGGGKINMIDLLNRALAERLVNERNHFSNQIDKCIEEGLIRDPAAVSADAVLEAMRQHVAAKDLQREAVGK
jgi:hypothetical protein